MLLVVEEVPFVGQEVAHKVVLVAPRVSPQIPQRLFHVAGGAEPKHQVPILPGIACRRVGHVAHELLPLLELDAVAELPSPVFSQMVGPGLDVPPLPRFGHVHVKKRRAATLNHDANLATPGPVA